jgi:crotonobetainyl-CoA:carnitine CoA-transferase CaiB-like acyl-CoA transferase
VQHEVPPPTLGQHTEEVLRDLLKKNPSEIARLRSEGIV